MSVQEVIHQYGLAKHPEGGYFRSSAPTGLPQNRRAPESFIYFLLNGSDYSAWHQIDSVEEWTYLQGNAPLKIYYFDRQKQLHVQTLNRSEDKFTVPKNVWFAASLDFNHINHLNFSESTLEESYVLCSCVCRPSFSYSSFKIAEHEELLRECPNPSHHRVIKQFFREEAVVPIETTHDFHYKN